MLLCDIPATAHQAHARTTTLLICASLLVIESHSTGAPGQDSGVPHWQVARQRRPTFPSCAFYWWHTATRTTLGALQLAVLHQRASFESIRIYPHKAY